VFLGRRSSDRNRDFVRAGKPVVTLPAGFVAPLQYVNASDRFTTLSASYRIADSELEDVVNAAAAVAAQLVRQLTLENACLAGSGDFASCLAPIVRARGELLLRRPLTDAEVAAHVALGARFLGRVDRAQAAELVFKALLSAPEFLYRTELGHPVAGDGARRALTSFEVASALSYTLLDGPPDATLWSLAAQGRLVEPDVISAEVKRLLEPLQESVAVNRFLGEYLRYDQAAKVPKDPIAGLKYNAAALVGDTAGFIRNVLATAGRRDFLSTLLSSTAVVSGADTRPWYVPGSDQVGILGQPAWLIAFSEPDHNDPIRRGKFVYESLLCGTVPALPIDNVPELSQDPNRTLRDRLNEITGSGGCQACHGLMNPIGYGFEGFDHYGRPRSQEAGRPADDSGALVGSGDQDGPFRGVKGLAAKLVASRKPARCFAAHAFEYLMGRKPQTADGCALADANLRFSDGGGDLVALLQQFFVSPSFLVRTP
jgi:hypothetical protein